MSKLNLAPGVLFDKEKHEYFYKGKKLSGVTGVIAKRLGMKYNGDLMEEFQRDGLHVHEAIENWINTGEFTTVHDGANWVRTELLRMFLHGDGFQTSLHAEVIVSDFKKYASAVDVISVCRRELLTLVDIKRSFKREYCTWQLSIYKYFIEKYTKWKVEGLFVVCVKDRQRYTIHPYSIEDVEELLYAEEK